MNFLERALPLLERGFSLIPLEVPALITDPRRGKVPLDELPGKSPATGLVPQGAKNRTRDRGIIEAWAERLPDANVGICADENFLILDSDDVEGLCRKLNGIPATYSVESSPGKRHYYFRRPSFEVKNLELGAYGSLRVENFYVVGAGSVHPKTGMSYTVISDDPVTSLDYQFFQQLLKLAETAQREIERITVNWDGKEHIPEGMRHYFLRGRGAAIWNGDEDETIAKLQELNEQFCGGGVPDEWITRYVNSWLSNKEPVKPAVELILGGPRVQRHGYVLEPIGKWDRWFALGQVGQIYGASGAGKSTFALQMLEAVTQGADFLGHRTQPRSILIVPLDRNGEALHETLDRMRIPRDLFPWAALPEDVLMDSRLAAPEVNRLLEEHGRPEILLLEGMDTLCLDQTQKGIVPFIRSFQRIAEHHGTAIIGTWGSPKRMSAPREQYKGLRDAASGSGMLGRMCTTMVYVREDYETGTRTVECGHRQCAHERFEMRFKEDRLALFAASDIPEAEPTGPIDVLISRFTWEQLKDKGLMSKATYYRRKAELEPKSRLSQVELPGEDLPELVS